MIAMIPKFEVTNDYFLENSNFESAITQETGFFYPSTDVKLFVRKWTPKVLKSDVLLFFVHGMTEHSGIFFTSSPLGSSVFFSGRYFEATRKISMELGCVVFSYDQRGHGHTVTKPAGFGDIVRGLGEEKVDLFRLMITDFEKFVKFMSTEGSK